MPVLPRGGKTAEDKIGEPRGSGDPSILQALVNRRLVTLFGQSWVCHLHPKTTVRLTCVQRCHPRDPRALPTFV